MSRLRVAPVVEGQGEDRCIRGLLQRIWSEIVGGEYIHVEKPSRHPGSWLKLEDGLRAAVRKALGKLSVPREPHDPCLVLVLVDADGDCPSIRGPQLLSWAKEVDRRIDTACVVVNVEYETWFVAAAESLQDYLELRESESIPDDPEGQGCKTHWIEQRFRDRAGHREYQKARDQPRMTAAMDLALCRRRSRSFDKLCRELERRAVQVGQGSGPDAPGSEG